MWKIWSVLGASEVGLAALSQIQVLPDNLIGILAQIPLVAGIIWLQLQNQKWLEHMLAVQRESIVSIYESQQKLLNTMLDHVEQKQNRMSDRIELLTQQVAISSSTMAEITKVDDVIDRLMEKIGTK